MIEADRRRKEELLRDKILNHVERYRLTVPWVVAKLFFPAHLEPDRKRAVKKAGSLLSQYTRGRILAEGECPGEDGRERPKYYLPAGATPGENAINADISLLWFCHADDVPRHRLNRNDLKDLMEELPYKNIAHCIEGVRGIEGVKGAAVIYRMAPTTAEVKEIIRMARRHLKDARRKFAPLIDSGDYGFAILVDKAAKAQEIAAALAAPHPNGGPPLTEQARFVVHVAPRAESFAQALREKIEGDAT